MSAGPSLNSASSCAASSQPAPPTLGSHPTALVMPARGRWLATRLWWVVLASIVLAVVLAVGSLKAHGPSITIRFSEGHGLKPGDVLKHRGIAIGEVSDVSLNSDLSGVVVHVQLDAKAAHIARRGSQFWIERPRVSLSRVSGLETVVGAKYLGVLPGPERSPNVVEFDGVESPPTLSEPDFIEITISFREGRGLQVSDPVRHRGIVVGEVTAVDLNHELSAVSVRVRLSGEAHHLAREGTQFWVEHPRVSMTEIRGLDTLIGGRFLAVIAGPDEAKPRDTFEGLDVAPVAEIPAGALEFSLHAPQRWGVDRGVPVTYRGLKVGQVVSVGLSSDGTNIEVRAYVESRFRSLVRQNSLFWSTSGIDVNFGFSGLQFNADTLATIAQGGVAFATPEPPGPQANTGQRFHYVKSPQEDWLTWRPHISTTDVMLPTDWPLPQPQRATVRWEERTFGFRRAKEVSGWLLLLDDGKLLGPADVLIPTEKALDAITLEVAGQEFVVTTNNVKRTGLLAKFSPDLKSDTPLSSVMTPWPMKRLREPTAPEDSLILTAPQSAPLPLAASSLTPREDAWDVTTSQGISSASHGAPVISSRDGYLIGFLLCNSKTAQVARH